MSLSTMHSHPQFVLLILTLHCLGILTFFIVMTFYWFIVLGFALFGGTKWKGYSLKVQLAKDDFMKRYI